MGTQTAIADLIQDKGADYVLALKGNQSTTHDEIMNFFDQAEAIDFEGVEVSSYHTVEKGHGRYEQRHIYACEDLDWLPCKEKWTGLRSIILIVSERTLKGKTSVERRYYISSLPADARALAYAIRSHWGIENQCHWVLDVSFREDSQKAKSGNIPQNMSLLRRMALNILKQDKSSRRGIECKRKEAGWDCDYLLQLLGIKFS